MAKTALKDYEAFKRELLNSNPSFRYLGDSALWVAYRAYLKDPGNSDRLWGKDTSSKGSAKKTEYADPDDEFISFRCVNCNRELRISLPLSSRSYNCRECKTQYQTVRADDSPVVFLVIPSPDRPVDAGAMKERVRRQMSPAAKAALAAFDLDQSVTFKQVQAAYRELIKSYHPDKVASLGSELKKLAEKKTKEINAAYQILESFYRGK